MWTLIRRTDAAGNVAATIFRGEMCADVNLTPSGARVQFMHGSSPRYAAAEAARLAAVAFDTLGDGEVERARNPREDEPLRITIGTAELANGLIGLDGPDAWIMLGAFFEIDLLDGGAC